MKVRRVHGQEIHPLGFADVCGLAEQGDLEQLSQHILHTSLCLQWERSKCASWCSFPLVC